MLTPESFLGLQEETLNHFRKMEKEKLPSTPLSPWRCMQDGGMGVLPKPCSPQKHPLCSHRKGCLFPLVSGEIQCQGTDDTRKVDFITSNENTADFEVLGKVDDGFLIPLPTQTLCRVLYTY